MIDKVGLSSFFVLVVDGNLVLVILFSKILRGGVDEDGADKEHEPVDMHDK